MSSSALTRQRQLSKAVRAELVVATSFCLAALIAACGPGLAQQAPSAQPTDAAPSTPTSPTAAAPPTTAIKPVIVTTTKSPPPAPKASRPKVEAKAASPAVSANVVAAPQTSSAGTGAPGVVAAPLATPPVVDRYQLPQKALSTTAEKIEQTVNLKDPEDAVKYMPSLFVRKRNDGDNSSVLATRSWGLNSSARTLIYQDGILLSALIGNNNNAASPKWNLVSPESIARIDFLDGPFSAAYPGNAMGGVLLMTSKTPEKLEATAKETVSVMPFQQYGTKATYVSSQTSASVGSRVGAATWFLSSTYQNSNQQPLTYTTSGGVPAGTTGTFLAQNKQGLVANVVGTGVYAHSRQMSTNLSVGIDVAPGIKLSYGVGLWSNEQNSDPQTYLKTASGAATFGGVSNFASGKYDWDQLNLSNSIALKSDTKGPLDFEVTASTYNYLQDSQRSPFTVGTGATFSQNGRIVRLDGTNWQNGDAKFIWRPQGAQGTNEVSFGIHADRYYFDNPTYASSLWNNTSSTGTGQLYSLGRGETRTSALWAQDAIRLMPDLKLTLGGRLEAWRAFDGYNVNTTTNAAGVVTSTAKINQPDQSSTNFSPKASLSYDIDKAWNLTGSFGQAYRYPTVTELYQNITVGGVATFANPNLKPEEDLNGQVVLEHKWSDGRLRFTGFHEHVNNAILSQTTLATNPNTLAQTPTTTIGNVAAIRIQGIEVAAEKNDVFIKGLQLFGSITYADSRILSDPTWAGTDPLTGKPNQAAGNRVPYVPDWRSTFGYTYRPTEAWAWTVAGRYSGKQYSTLDNTDIVGKVYGAFDNYFVLDTKLHYEPTKNLSFDLGIDNVLDRQYFLFHPFPGRTYVMAGRLKF